MMKLNKILHTDVLVIGSGLAGSMAAIEAARTGGRTTIVSAGEIFTGSSFCPGTWGFGLIAPENASDAQDLKQTICDVGMGMADENLVDVFIDELPDAIEALQKLDIPLKRPGKPGEKAYVPCFDHKTREWYGIVQQDAKMGFQKAFDTLGIQRIPNMQMIDLIQRDARVCGAIGVDGSGFVQIMCNSCVIATGGMSGLFDYAFGPRDVCGMGQALALRAGAQLVNLEFYQMMPGFISPCRGTIYNEKVFASTAFYDAQGNPLLGDLPDTQARQCLELRATHGPFTSRLKSREVDFRLYRAFRQDARGVLLRYENMESQPEFVQTYFEWLKQQTGLTQADEVRIGVFYHAANGGIRIDKNAWTRVQGLYACGEATGGMHGADRIGGLSTANGLVFGRIAGKNAALFAEKQDMVADCHADISACQIEQPEEKIAELRYLMSSAAMVFRDAHSIENALEKLDGMESELRCAQNLPEQTPDKTLRIERFSGALIMARAICRAIQMRKESRGSHYRADAPETDAGYEKRILHEMGPSGLQTFWEEKAGTPNKDEVLA